MQQLLKKSKMSYEKDGDLKAAAEVPAWGWVKEEDKKDEDQDQDQGQQSRAVKQEGSGG